MPSSPSSGSGVAPVATATSSFQGTVPASLSTSVQLLEPKKYDFKVKVINPRRKKDYATYVLRGIRKDNLCTPLQLKKELLTQLGADIISPDLDFSIGYMKGNLKVTIISSADISEIWTMIAASKTVVIWCDRVQKQDSSDNESEIEELESRTRPKKKKITALEEKKNRDDNTVQMLREKHQGRYNTMQLRLWAEIVDGGTWK